MGIQTEIIANQNAAAPSTEREIEKRRPGGKKIYKPHMATKVRWALEDSMCRAMKAQARMRAILDWLEEQRRYDAGDTVRLARLGRLDHEIAYLALEVSEMERILKGTMAESKRSK